MTNFWAVMTDITLVGSYRHVLFTAFLTSTMLHARRARPGICARARPRSLLRQDIARSAKLALIVALVAVVATCSSATTRQR